MKSFIRFLNESNQVFQKTVALVGGSFKPPHAGHFAMVQEYAQKADQVVVLISDPKSAKSIRKTNLGTIITPEMAKQIWEIYIQRYGLTNKVVVDISPDPSPIGALYKYIDSNLNDVNVIFGVSTKGDDYKRFLSAPKYYEDNPHIHIMDPKENAVEPFNNNGVAISATDIRNNIDKPDVIAPMLPSKLTQQDIQQIMKILGNDSMTEDENTENVIEQLKPLDETECIHLDITDDLLSTAKIVAYNVGQMVTKNPEEKIQPYNPKKFPEKAIRIKFDVSGLPIEIYLDTKTKKWDSALKYNGIQSKLSPDQFGQFFKSQFYYMLQQKLQNTWPLSDKFYADLYTGICEKEMSIGEIPAIDEDNEVDKSMTNKDIDNDNKRDYTSSGRRIVHFGDTQVSKKGAKFFCWPDLKKSFNWSSWADWQKIKPLCRMRFKHGNYMYGLSLSTLGDDYDTRGFRAYNLTLEPKLQWLTKEETMEVMQLAIVNKFLKHCVEKISKFVEMKPEDVLKQINNPEKLTLKDIIKTQTCIRRTMNSVIKNKQIDSFKWKN